MNLLAVTTASLAILLGGCQTTDNASAGGTALSDAEVLDAISGNTMDATNTAGKPFRIYFDESGTLLNQTGDTGTWEIKDGSICNTYESRGFAGCDKVFRTQSGELYYVVASGKQGTIQRTEPGNDL